MCVVKTSQNRLHVAKLIIDLKGEFILKHKSIIITGGIIGLLSVLLVKLGNPDNMGICVACFIRDIAGALGLHRVGVVQYIRPEIIGFIIGAMIISLINKEFRARGGSSPFIRFILGFFVMIGALVFLGCPLRLILRLASGDLNAILGLVGFTAGILIGTHFLRKGFTLGRNYSQSKANGFILPIISIGLLMFLVAKPAFIFFSETGPAAAHAPMLIALGVGLVVGVLAQQSRMCLAGGIRDVFLIKDPHLLIGFTSIFVIALVANSFWGFFNFSFIDQPIAHTDALWNFLGMSLTGFASILLGGCPLRQTIVAGEGDTDAAITFMGLVTGAAFAHNFSLAATPSGVGFNGKFAVILGIIVVLGIATTNIKSMKKLK